MMIRGIRGATTVERDTEEEILQKTKQLLEKIIEENHTKPEDVVQMLLSATPDLHAVFPAKAVRELSGWQYAGNMYAGNGRNRRSEKVHKSHDDGPDRCPSGSDQTCIFRKSCRIEARFIIDKKY